MVRIGPGDAEYGRQAPVGKEFDPELRAKGRHGQVRPFDGLVVGRVGPADRGGGGEGRASYITGLKGNRSSHPPPLIAETGNYCRIGTWFSWKRTVAVSLRRKLSVRKPAPCESGRGRRPCRRG